MPRKPTHVDESALDTLRQFIRTKASLECTSFYEIQLLQDKIRKEVSDHLSVQTLSRFFGLTKNGFKPSAGTLNILARYTDYHSFGEFELLNKNIETTDSSVIFHMITSMFSQIEPGSTEEKGLIQVLKNVYRMIERDDRLCMEIYPFMASTQFGRKYFFEKFVHIDALGKHYGAGIKYYLLHAIEREQQFFAYGTLCFRYLLTGDDIRFYHYYHLLQQFELPEVMSFHPWLIGRYFASAVYRQCIEKQTPDIGDEARKVLSQKNHFAGRYGNFPYIEYVLGEALILAEDFEAAWAVLNSCNHPASDVPEGAEEGYLAQFDLLKLFSGFFSGKIHPSRMPANLSILKKRPFYFLSVSYFSIFLFILETNLDLKPTIIRNLKNHIMYLVEKTGFVHFLSLIKKEEPAKEIISPLMIINEKKIG